MASIQSVKSGLWSAGDTWNSGTVPADGDTVLIVGPHVVTYDYDMSGFTTGIDLTIGGAAGGGGTLQCSTNPGKFWLSIKSGTNLRGTNAAAWGSLLAGTAETALPNNVWFTVECKGSGATCARVDATYLNVGLYCTDPTNKYVRLTSQTFATNNLFNIDTDVTGDAPWTTTAGRNVVCLVNTNRGQDTQITTLSTISTTTLVTAANADSTQLAGAYIFLCSRNIEILYNGTNSALGFTTAVPFIRCAIRNTGTLAGTGIGGNTTYNLAEIAATITNFASGASQVNRATFTGTFLGCTTAMSTSFGSVMSGIVGGSGTACLWFVDAIISGLIVGCTYSVSYSTGLFTGTSYGCQYPIYLSSFTIGSTASITKATGALRSGRAVVLRGATIGSSDADLANSGDVYLTTEVRGYGAGLNSATQVNGLDLYYQTNLATVFMYDIADSSGTPQLGQIKGWTAGGSTYSESPPAAFPGANKYAHKMTFTSASFQHYQDFPLMAYGNEHLIIKVHIKQNTTGMTATPRVQLIDPGYQFDSANSKLVDKVIADNTNWQTHVLTYKPTTDRQIILRVIGKNASSYLHFAYEHYTQRNQWL